MSLYTIEYRSTDNTDDAYARETTIIDTEELGTEEASSIEKQAIAIAPTGFLFHSMAKRPA